MSTKERVCKLLMYSQSDDESIVAIHLTNIHSIFLNPNPPGNIVGFYQVKKGLYCEAFHNISQIEDRILISTSVVECICQKPSCVGERKFSIF